MRPFILLLRVNVCCVVVRLHHGGPSQRGLPPPSSQPPRPANQVPDISISKNLFESTLLSSPHMLLLLCISDGSPPLLRLGRQVLEVGAIEAAACSPASYVKSGHKHEKVKKFTDSSSSQTKRETSPQLTCREKTSIVNGNAIFLTIP